MTLTEGFAYARSCGTLALGPLSATVVSHTKENFIFRCYFILWNTFTVWNIVTFSLTFTVAKFSDVNIFLSRKIDKNLRF